MIKKFFLPLAKNQESLNLSNDAAIIKLEKQNLVVSTDMIIEGQHFEKKTDPTLIAKKLLRVNLSDLAAMGAKPYGYLLNLAIPPKNLNFWLNKFTQGLKEDQKEFGLSLFGGDLCRSSKIHLSATIFGKVKEKVHKINSAKKGSEIFVSGYIGDASIAHSFSNKNLKLKQNFKNYFLKRLLIPEPKIKLGLKLLNFAEFCTDLSDGLIGDLEKVCDSSGLCANIFFDQIPLSNATKEILKRFGNRKKIWETILCGGDDYELIFSLDPISSKKLKKEIKIYNIGFFSEGRGVKIFDYNKRLINFRKDGFSHF